MGSVAGLVTGDLTGSIGGAPDVGKLPQRT